MSDNEIRKMNYSIDSQRAKKNGFEGCANYPKSCNFSGYYLAEYSKEGLCKECEIKKFPERFQGCVFCLNPQKYTGACFYCEVGFREWCVSHLTFRKEPCTALEVACGAVIKQMGRQEFTNNPSTKWKWPGFRTDDNSWVIPEGVTRIDEELTWETKEAQLVKALQSRGIKVFL